MFRRAVVLGCWVTAVLSMLGVAGAASAQDLLVAGDDGHLWLVVETVGEDGDAVQVYHRGVHDDSGEMQTLEPIPGRLRPGGVAAGAGRLVLVMDSGDVVTRRPYLPPMGWGWAYRSGTLPKLPDGCSLRSMVADEHAVWVLVRVDDPELLTALDSPPAGRLLSSNARDRRNLLLGLPPGVRPAGEYRPPGPDAEVEGDGAEPDEPREDSRGESEPEAGNEPVADSTPEAGDGSESIAPGEAGPGVGEGSGIGRELLAEPAQPVPTVPAYRLLRSTARGWRTEPLPEGFGLPRQASLVSRGGGDTRPVVVAESRRFPGELEVLLPGDGASWIGRTYRLPRLRVWSAVSVAGQVLVGLERDRLAQQVVIDVYLLRSGRAVWAGVMWVDTADTARWRLLGQGGDALLLARPGPMMTVPAGQTPEPSLMAGYRLPSSVFGEATPAGDEPLGEFVYYLPQRRSRWENNADWLIQIIVLTGALVLLMLFWKRTPRSREVRLPKNVHLVPWSRRLIGTLIDLMPGLWLAGAVYGLGWDEIVLRHWPGTPFPKPPAAMGPGWLVIGVTVFHTTVFEFITARSIGKWLTGTYVSDFRGVPAPPGASLARAATRVFDLVAWMLLLLPLISPHRQRLGDILAKTLVVYRDPPPQEDKPEDRTD